jgi:glycosyltransferase involved in cell wall biosynthesis
MKLLFIHSGADLYGASRSVLRLTRRLIKDGFLVTILLPFDGPLAPALKEVGADVIIEPSLTTVTRTQFQHRNFIEMVIGNLRSFFILYRRIRQTSPSLVHTMTAVIPGGGLAAKLSGVPHIWHVRESFAEFPGMWRIYRWYMVLLSKFIITVSTPIASQFPAGMRKVKVIHNGFPREEFDGITTERIKAFRHSFHLNDEGILVGVVGRIKYRRKAQEDFVEAAALLREQFPHTRYLCIGSPYPGNEQHLEQLLGLIQVRGLENDVICTGDVADIKAAISALDVLVLPSAQPEPFGGVVIEAMALGKPVVATSIGGSIEQVVDGSTGFLVPPANPMELAGAIRKLLADSSLRARMGAAGRQRFLDLFEFDMFYRNILNVYSQSVNKEITP